MVGVSQNNSCSGISQLGRPKPLHRSLGAYGHEEGGLKFSVCRLESAQTSVTALIFFEKIEGGTSADWVTRQFG